LFGNQKKGKPQHCGKKMQRLYIRKGTAERRWIAVGYYCNVCRKMIKDSDLALYRRSEDLMTRPELVPFLSNPQKIILDIGEKLTKVGFGGEREPRLILDSLLYYDKNNKSFIQNSDYIETSKTVKSQKTLFCDDISPSLKLDVVDLFLTRVFEILGVNPKDKSIMIIEKNYKNNYVEALYGKKKEINETTLPEDIKEKLKEKRKVEYLNYDKYVKFPRRELSSLLFDNFEASQIYFSNGELLSLYANDMITGLVVNIGTSSTRIIPVFQGFIITHAINVRDIGTAQVFEKILEYLDVQNNFKNVSQHTKYLIQKRLRLSSEEFCYISLDPTSEETKWYENEKLKKYIHLFENEYVEMDQIRYLATEILFEKEELSITKKKGTLTDAIIETIQKCDVDLTKSLYSNILVTGGGSFYEGLAERLLFELKEKVQNRVEVSVNTKPNRLISSWIGGSILSILPDFENSNLWVTREEYNEKGVSAIDRCI